jgi:outer membrane lipoprotein carrier protein
MGSGSTLEADRASSSYVKHLLVVCLAALPAGATEISTVLNGIEARYNRPQTLQLLFEQTYTAQGRPPRTESGVVYLRKPGRMRWEYHVPPGKLFVSDGEFVYFYSPAANRVEKMRLKDSGDMRVPLAFLIGRVDLRRDFREFRSRPEGDALRIVALPKSDRAPFTQVEFLVAPDHSIRRLVIQGEDGSVMSFGFREERVNPPLARDLFRFQAPPGAELVEVRGEAAVE